MKKLIYSLTALTLLATSSIEAKDNSCKNQLFTLTIKKEVSIADVIDNLADSCGLSVIVKDMAAQSKMKKKLYFIKLKDASLYTFLDTVLKDNNLQYKLVGNKLIISYLQTRTFKIHYIASDRKSSSNANINVASGGGSKGKNGSSASGMTIQSDDEFNFWKNLKDEIHKILVVSGDGSLHFTKKGDKWVGPDGTVWAYNPLEPIVDPKAGLVTVTGTPEQLRRVSRYISALANQVKSQVMIDVKILSVTLNRDHQTGIDWNKLYGLENFTVTSLSSWAKLKSGEKDGGITRENRFKVEQTKTIDDVIRFLRTQGDVKAISNPKVMTLNNQPALISVGKELFYKTTSTTTTTGTNGVTSNSEKVDSVFAGVLLDITPEIDNRGTITLKINPSITETLNPVTQSGTRTMPPDLVRRQISTVIKVKNGKHAIIGGLISSVESVEKSKVPLIGDIPLIGSAFQRERKIKRTEELVVIITPRIVNSGKGLSLKSLGYRSIVK